MRAAGRAVKGASERDRRSAAVPPLTGGRPRLHRRGAGPGPGSSPTPRAPDSASGLRRGAEALPGRSPAHLQHRSA